MKGESNLTSLVIILIIIIGIFTGMFIYMNQRADDSGMPLDSKYNETYQNLSKASNDIDTNIQNIKSNLGNISEATSAYQVAINGFKGLGNLLKAPIVFINSAWTVATQIIGVTDIIPTWAKVLIIMGIVAAIVLLILSILKGDTNKI